MGRIQLRNRINRVLTGEERERYAKAVKEVESEIDEIRARGRAIMDAHHHLRHTLEVLKARRLELGLSLSDVQRLTGIDRARLSRLESDADANPTIETLNRIAHALGVEVRVSVVNVGG